MTQEPSGNGSNGGRDPRTGRFREGNKGGPGNPHARRVAEIRSALLKAVSPDDIREIVQALVTKAKAGDVAAAREVFDRCVGKPVSPGVQQPSAGESLLRSVQIVLPGRDDTSHAGEGQST